jgi:proteasome beta subunit
MNENKNELSTGTTTVGLVCKDCIVLAADKRATAGYMVVDRKTQKVHKISERFALTIAGSVSEAQMLIKVIKAQIALKENQTNRETTCNETANMLANLLYNSIRTPSMIQSITHFLFAGYDKEVSLFDLYPDGSITKIDEFVASGSGSVYALGVLENSYKKDLTEKEGIELVKKAVNASLKRDIASGNGINIAVVNKDGVRYVESKDVNTGLY